jgi:hypothetical protein
LKTGELDRARTRIRGSLRCEDRHRDDHGSGFTWRLWNDLGFCNGLGSRFCLWLGNGFGLFYRLRFRFGCSVPLKHTT